MGLFFSEQQQQPQRSKYYPTLREAPRVDGTILPMFPHGSAIEPVVYENKPRSPQGFYAEVINAGKERLNNISNPQQSDVGQFSPTYGSALNVAGQAGGFFGDVIGAGLKAITPEPLRQSIEDFAGVVLPGNPVYETAKDIWNAIPTGTQNDIGNVANATLIIPAVGMIGRGANLSRDAIGTLREVKKIPGIVGASEKLIERGKKIISDMMKDHTDRPSAMYRDDVGSIEFPWGKEGNPKKDYEGGFGVSHIIAKHGEPVANKVVEVIAKGDIVKESGPPNGTRINIQYDGHTAILSLYKNGNHQAWLLTGWKDD